MFRLYSSRMEPKIEADAENDMSEFQERLQKFGARLIGLLGRRAVIVHNDIIKLSKIARRSFGSLYRYLRKISRQIRAPRTISEGSLSGDFSSDTGTEYTRRSG